MLHIKYSLISFDFVVFVIVLALSHFSTSLKNLQDQKQRGVHKTRSGKVFGRISVDYAASHKYLISSKARKQLEQKDNVRFVCFFVFDIDCCHFFSVFVFFLLFPIVCFFV